MELSRNKFVFYILMAVVIVLLNPYTLKLPLINQVLGFFLAVFLPGFLFLNITGVKEIDGVDRMLYPLGISIALLMFTGLLINTLYPFLGIKTPFKSIYIDLTFFTLLFALIFLYFIFVEDSFSSAFDLSKLLDPVNVFLFSIPFVTIIGVYLRNVYGITFLLIISLLIISLVPILVAFGKIKKGSYIIAVSVVSISLLFHTSLVTNYI